MKCPNCSNEIVNDSKFCEVCGTKITQKIILDESRKIWLGVCAGEGNHYARKWGGKTETWTIISRIIYVVLTCLYGIGLIVYICAYYNYKNQ